MKNENPLKEYIHGKFGVIYDNIIAILEICVLNILTVYCCWYVTICNLELGCSSYVIFWLMLLFVCVDIFGSYGFWFFRKSDKCLFYA